MTTPPPSLKPCPFCGGEARSRFHQLEETWSITCGSCAASMPYVGLTEAEAITDWNTRASDTLEADVAALREALDLFLSFGCPVCNGDCGSANPSVNACPMRARTTLERTAR